MHLPFILILIFVVVALVLVAFADWLALQIFGLKTTKANLAKIVGIEVLLTAATSFIGTVKNAPGAVSLLLLIVDAIIWAALIKHYIADRYSVGRAIGSYITSYLLILGFSLVAAIVMLASFVQTFAINGDSMAPALHSDDKVLVYKFEKRPSDNAIIVYKTGTGVHALGRVHGIPGQSVSISSGQVVVAGQTESIKSYTLGSNQYYVTSDNVSYNIPPRIINGSSIIGIIGPKL